METRERRHGSNAFVVELVDALTRSVRITTQARDAVHERHIQVGALKLEAVHVVLTHKVKLGLNGSVHQDHASHKHTRHHKTRRTMGRIDFWVFFTLRHDSRLGNATRSKTFMKKK